MALVVKITGGPTVFDATMATDASIATHIKVTGTVYPDDHPMLEHANSAAFSNGYGQDASGVYDGTSFDLYPVGYPFSQTVPNYKIQEFVDATIVNLKPIAPVESQFAELGGPFDGGGQDSSSV
jgi:hypothetical protein